MRDARAIAIDVGDQNGLRAGAANFHEIVDSYAIANTFEVYPGRAPARSRSTSEIRPAFFFGKNLCSGKLCM
jgi:hypothetical protein